MGKTTNDLRSDDLAVTDDTAVASRNDNDTSDEDWTVANAIGEQAASSADDETESPEEIRARIELTRAEMSHTINALQEKLDPERLKEQLSEQIHDQVHTAKESVREATIGKAEELMHSASETVSNLTQAGADKAGEVAEQVSEATRPAVEAVERVAHSAADTIHHTGSAIKSSGSSLVDTIKQNPIPAAMAAIGLGWLMMSSKQEHNGHGYTGNYSSYNPHYSGSTSSPLAEAQNRVSDTVDSARDTVSDVADQARDKAANLADSARDTASNLADSAGNLTDEAKLRAGILAEEAQRKAAHLAEEARHKAENLGQQAQHTAHRAQETFQSSLQDNPFAIGVVAMAIGAAVGMSVPVTQPEQQLMGETRDKIVDDVQHAAQDTLHKVRQVAERVVEEAGKTATNVAQQQGLTGNA